MSTETLLHHTVWHIWNQKILDLNNWHRLLSVLQNSKNLGYGKLFYFFRTGRITFFKVLNLWIGLDGILLQFPLLWAVQCRLCSWGLVGWCRINRFWLSCLACRAPSAHFEGRVLHLLHISHRLFLSHLSLFCSINIPIIFPRKCINYNSKLQTWISSISNTDTSVWT